MNETLDPATEQAVVDALCRCQRLDGPNKPAVDLWKLPVAAQGMPAPSVIEQMCSPGARPVRPTEGLLGAPIGQSQGGVRVLHRGTGNGPSDERPPMLLPGSPHRKAGPGLFGTNQ
jgi:hypothetical protein